MATALLAAHPTSAKAVDFYWDTDGFALGDRLDGTGLGGGGLWDFNSLLWWNGIDRVQAFPDFGPDSALHTHFLGAPGTVTLGGALLTGGMTLHSDKGNTYHLTGGTLVFDNDFSEAPLRKLGAGSDLVSSALTLSDPVNIDVQDGRLTLSGLISGAGGIIKNGTGTLILGGGTSNPFTGVNFLNNGITLALMQGNTLNALGATGAGQHTVIGAGATFATANDLDNATPGLQTTGGYGTISEAFTIQGQGYLGQGALRKIMGREQDTLGGAISMDGAARIQADYGTLHFSGAVGVDHELTLSGAAGFLSLGGVVTGGGDIVHYGLSGFRMQNSGNTHTGSILSTLGEIRGDSGDSNTGNNPYDTIASLTLKDSALRLNYPNAAGSGANAANARFSATAPVSMKASQIYVDNASFNGGSTFLFDYALAQTFGATTLEGGGNKITIRSADAGSVTLTFTDFQRTNPGTMLELQIDNLTGGATANWGASSKHRLINGALEAGSTTVPLIPWAFYGAEFLEYDPVALGGFGYSQLDAADYTSNTAEGTWAAGQNLKIDNNHFSISADRTIQSLNIQGATDRIVGGAAGTTLTIESGGILTRDDGHVISVPFLTAGAGGNYELFDIAWNFNIISSVITDNGANPVSLIKAGANTTRFLGNNTYTGITYLVEGMFQESIGAKNVSSLGTGNFNLVGDSDSQGVYDNDNDFTRPLGTGPGEVQLTGGGGFGSGSVGFSAYGAPIDLNFGGSGATVTWGSATFDPGIFSLNGGNATHVLTMVNGLDLGGEQRYIRLDGNASGGNRAVLGTITGDLDNGGLVKQGGGVLFFDGAKSYTGSTIIREGELWLRHGTGTAGADVTGNDLQIGGASRLKIDGPSSIGSRQMIILENSDDNSASAIAYGAGYGDGSGIRFHSLVSAHSAATPRFGPFEAILANQQSGNDRRNRIAVQISGNHAFQADLTGQIKTVAPDVEAWFGADTGNGTFTGPTLSSTGRDKTGGNQAFRLGSGGGTLTIAQSDVLDGAYPLIVGAQDETARINIGGVVYLPEAQNYTGTISQTVGTELTAGTLIGSGGILVVGQDGALNSANPNISLRGGEIRLNVDSENAYLGTTDSQYGSRNLFVKSANGLLRLHALAGGQFGEVVLNDLTMRMDNADRVFTVNRIGTTHMNTVFGGAITLENGTSARGAFFDVGDENNYHSGLGNLLFEGVVGQTGTGGVTLQKRQGGTLVLANDNTYLGSTQVQQGRLVLAHTGAAGVAGSDIVLSMQNDRRGDIEFRVDGAGPFVFENQLVTSGNDGGETRVVTVGSYDGSSADQVVQLDGDFTIGHGGAHAANGTGSSAIYFDGFNGYDFEVLGTTTLNRSITFRTRGAVTTLSGIVTGAASSTLEKSEQGTLILSNNNTYAGGTAIYHGSLVAAHDNAFGTAISNVAFASSTAFSEILASGTRTLSRGFINSATGSTQTLGGLDAGAKLFTGGITLASRGLNLTSVLGGDTTFTGTISGAFGIHKVGSGTVILDPTAGGNTFTTGGVSVSEGTLVGEAKAAGNPFGTNNPFTLASGTLRLNNHTGAANVTTSSGALTLNAGNAAIVVDGSGAGGNSTRFHFGSLVRSNSATLTLKGLNSDLGAATGEIVSFTSSPALSLGTIGTWAVIQGENDNAAHYAGISAGQIVTATYTASGVDLDSSAGATALLDVSGVGGNLTADRSVHAFRSDANVNLNTFTLNLGNPNSVAGGQAGMLLNGGADLLGGTLDFGTNTLAIYTDDAAVSTISAAITNFRSNANNTLSSRFIKYGPGTLELSGANTFQGNLEVNQGTLSLAAPNVMPNFGNLNVVTGTTVTIQPGASVLLNGHDQEFGNLAGSLVASAVRNIGGTLDLGGAVLTVGRQGASTTFSGQIIGGAGSQITKVGAGRLTLDHWNAAIPSTLGTLDIAQGVVSSLANDQSWASSGGFASSLPGSTEILLRGGEWEVRTFGDSTTNFQLVPLGNNLTHTGGNSILDTGRAVFGSGASNKILTFGNLSLDKQLFLVTGDNANYPRFDGTTTLTSHARIQTDAPLLLNGTITGAHSLTKTGGSNLEIGADNRDWNGGTVATDGSILFGSRYPEDATRYMGGSSVFSYSASANLGTGDIVINRNTALRINAPSNILTSEGQRVQVFGALQGNLPRIDLGLDAPVAAYGLRSLQEGALNLGLHDGLYTHTLDQAMLGNGKWGVGAWDTTYYTAATMGAGVDGVYRFLGINATLGITQSHALSGAAGLQVGGSQYHQGFAQGNTSASLRLYGDQSYTGNTLIFRSDNTGNTNNFLEILGDLESPVIDVFGRLTARGDGRFTDDSGAQVNTVNLYPGSNLRLDYSMDVNDTFVISRLDNSNLGFESDENKWGDTTPMTLDGATLNLISSSGRQNQETIGHLTVKNGAGLYLERNGTNGQIVLETAGLTRSGQATFHVRENADELGRIDLQGQKFFINDAAWVAANTDATGLLPVWMINPSRNTFLSYDSNLGVRNAAFTASTNSAGTGAAFLAARTATDIADYGPAVDNATLGGTANLWALRIGAAANNETTLTGGQINLHSGGLIIDNNNAAGRVSFSTTAVYFGDGSTPVEGVVFNDASSVTTLFGGVVTAAGLTVHGPGQIELTHPANAITGNLQMNGGTLFANGAGTLGTASVTIAGDWLLNNDGQQMAEIRLRTNNSVNTTFNNPIIVAENLAYARLFAERYTGTSTAGAAVTIPSLTIGGTDTLHGTSLIVNNSSGTNSANTHAIVVSGETQVNGTAPFGLHIQTQRLQLDGMLSTTSAAPLFKSGDGQLRLGADNTGWTGPVTLVRGEIAAIANSGNQFGTGDYTLNFGQIRLQSNTTRSFFDVPGQDLTVAGLTTFVTNRNGATAERNMTIGSNGGDNVLRTVNGAHLRFSADSFGDDLLIESRIHIDDSAVFYQDNLELRFQGELTGSGRLTKAGNYNLYLNENTVGGNAGWSGILDIQRGSIVQQAANDSLGGDGSSIIVRAGGALGAQSTAFFGTGAGVVSVTRSTTHLPVLGVRSAANFNSILDSYEGKFIGTGFGVIGIDNGQSIAVDPAMASRFGGNWFLGSSVSGGNGNLTANSVAPWGLGGDQFLIGGGSAQITLNPATAGSSQFSGANRMVIGSANTGFGTLTALFGGNGNNTYSGGTLVTRGRHWDLGYRGTALSLQGGAVGTGTTFRTPLGSGVVDVFGEVRIEGSSGTAVTTGGLTNANTWVFHPGSRVRFDNQTPFNGSGTTGAQGTGTIGGGGRWADTVGITLDGAVLDLLGDNTNHVANTEVIGDLTVNRGAEVVVRRNTGFGSELISSQLFRGSSTGTVMIRHDADLLGDAGAINTNRFIVTSGAGATAGQVPVNQNMVDPWIVSRSQNQFLKYSPTLGFQILTEGGSPANYLTSAGGTLDGADLPLNDGTEILNLITANGILGANLDVHALRTDRNIDVSADGLFTDIIIRSGGLMQAGNTPFIGADLYFGASGNGDGQALIWANNNTLQINGRIFASEVVKSGLNFLNINSDQAQFTGDWIINGGGVQFLTPGATGTGEVVLNGSHIADNDSVYNLTEVRYNYNSGTPDLFTWGGGKITAYDINRVYVPTASDRLQQIPAMDLRTTNTVSGTGQEGTLIFQVDSFRSTVRTGTVTLHDHYLIHVESGSFGTGSTVGVQFGGGSGTGGLVNQGLYDFRKVGDGVLSLGDNTLTFTGGRTLTAGEGAIRVLHNGAFGGAGNVAKIDSTGVLEIAVAGFSPGATLIQDPGSAERWAVDGARSGTVILPQGVSLQIMANQTGTQTVHLDGGSLMGYLPRDWEQVAVIHTLGSGITLHLASDSFLGQPYATSSNGAWDLSSLYDQGKINTTTGSNPTDPALRGSYLQIDGIIQGEGGITKVGQDLILLNGANTYGGSTRIEDGILQIGRHHALPVTSTLVLAGSSGLFDLNGYDQEVAGLSGSGGSVVNGAFAFNTLTVNQSTDSVFRGSLLGTVGLTKRGPGILELASANPHLGLTTLSEGMLRLHGDPGSNTTLATDGDDDEDADILIDGGTLEIAADEQIGNTAVLSINLGALHYGAATGLVETVSGFTNSGGHFSTGANTFIAAGRGVTFAGGTNTVGNGGLLRGSRFVINGGLNTVEGGVNGGVLHVASGGGLEFGGTDSPTLVLGSHDGVGGRLLLDGDVVVNATLTSGTASIVSSGTGANAGQVDLNGATRTFTVANGSSDLDLHVSATLVNGGLLKKGEGTLRLTGENTHAGPTVVHAGTLSIEQESNLGANPLASQAAQLQLDGGTLQTTGTFAIDDSHRGLTLGERGGTFDTADGTVLTITNVISGDLGDLSKTGAGTLVLTAANTYSSAANSDAVNHGTFLESGILLVNNTSGSGTGDGDVVVAGGTLGGFGSIGGDVRMTPGAGATLTASFDGIADRTLTIGGDLGMNTGNTWLVDLVQDVDGASGRIDIGGTFTLMAGTELEIDFNGTYTDGNVYTLAQYGSISGEFSYSGSIWTDDSERLLGGGFYRINYNDVGNTITLTAVPEPGTWLVMILVAVFGFYLHRRRQTQTAPC